jgi:hypothetical protein
LSLINSALVRIGETPLPSISENSAGGNAASVLYDDIKNECLARHPWRFALKETDLSELASGSYSDEWDHVYNPPTDLLRPLGLVSRMEFQWIGEEFYTRDSDATLIYIRSVGESYFPPWFIAAMVVELAASFCIAVTEDTTKYQLLQDRADRVLWPRARSQDSQSSMKEGLSIAIDELISAYPSTRP